MHAGKRASLIPFARKTRGSSRMRDYLQETTKDERGLLARELSAAVLHLTENGSSVHLEGLGIIRPQQRARSVVHHLETRSLVRRETECTLQFEKCLEITAFHRQRFAPLVEVKELAKRVHPRLPLAINAVWTKADLRRRIRGLIKHVLYETVVHGCSSQLSPIGRFYSLHNRQGSTIRDWCTGADIFLHSGCRRLIEADEPRFFEAPTYQDAWEPLRAAYAEPLAVFSLPLNAELDRLGCALAPGEAPEIRVAVFESRRPHEKSRVLTYCTEGLRAVAYERGSRAGTELVVQAAVDPENLSVPEWPHRALALGWILIQSSQSGAINAGVGLSSGEPLCADRRVRLSLIYATRFAALKSPARCTNGSFSYINLVGITEAEASVARRYSPEHLTALLEYKQLDQVTKPNRRCLVSHTGLLAEDRSEAVANAG